MDKIDSILEKKSTDFLEKCIYDESLVEYKRKVIFELLRRYNISCDDSKMRVIYDCMNCLSLTEVIGIVKCDNPFLAFIANKNVSDRLVSTKNRNYYDDGRIRVRKKVRIKKRKVLRDYD